MLPIRPAPEVVLTMRACTSSPALVRSRQCCTAQRLGAKWPFRCTRTTASHSSSVADTNMRSRTTPALLTTTSSRPNASMAASTRCWAPSQSATSSPFTIASPPIASMSATTSAAGPVVGLARAVELGADVVDDDTGALAGQLERVAAAEAPPGAGHDHDSSFAHPRHGRRRYPARVIRSVGMVPLHGPRRDDVRDRPVDATRRLARAVEERGLRSLWVPEHTHIPTSRVTPYPAGGDLPEEYTRTLDPFVALTAAAAATTTLRVGTCIAARRAARPDRHRQGGRRRSTSSRAGASASASASAGTSRR